MREKLLDLMKSEGLKPSQLAEMLAINPAGISHILAGRNKPGFDLLQKILRRFPRINPDWLLLDSDQMYRDDYTAPSKSSEAQPAANRIISDDLFATIGAAPSGVSREEFATPETSKPVTTAPPPGLRTNAAVLRIVLFYDDQTFESFTPSNPTKR